MKIENVAVISLEDYHICTRMKNIIRNKIKYIVQPKDYKIIPLTKGKYAKVDNDDFELLINFNWKCNYHNYERSVHLGLMHRFIMNCPKNKIIDHINHDRLDNRKANLRICTVSNNGMNRLKYSGFTSKYKGVCWVKERSLWKSSIKHNDAYIHLGFFENEKDAGLAYDKKAIELFGEFALLNFTKKKE